MIGRARRKFTCRRALPIIFMSAADKADLIHTQDYAQGYTKSFWGRLFTKRWQFQRRRQKSRRPRKRLIEVEQAVGECEVYGFVFDGEFDDEVVGGGDHNFFAAQVDDE